MPKAGQHLGLALEQLDRLPVTQPLQPQLLEGHRPPPLPHIQAGHRPREGPLPQQSGRLVAPVDQSRQLLRLRGLHGDHPTSQPARHHAPVYRRYFRQVRFRLVFRNIPPGASTCAANPGLNPAPPPLIVRLPRA